MQSFRNLPANVIQDQIGDRLQITYLTGPQVSFTPEEDGQDVIAGLTAAQKTLSPKYLYDDRGSELFEQICTLPEYYPTRAEISILSQYAPEIVQITGPCELIELGSGSATKARILLDAYQNLGGSLRYLPIDVSGGALEGSARELLQTYEQLHVHGLVSTYGLALANLPPSLLPFRLIAFLGSSIGNMPPEECQLLLRQITQALEPGEYLLLGADLQKDRAVLEAAYNDRQGVTAAFNKNSLSHLNWRFQADFILDQFQHLSFYNPDRHQIEIYLKSLVDQTVTLKALDLTVKFQAGELILSEVSRKFDLVELQQDLQSLGLKPIQAWTDGDRFYSLLLCQLQG